MEPVKLSTSALLARLFATSSFSVFQNRYRQELAMPSLPEFLDLKCRALHRSHESVILSCGLDRVYGHQIFCGRRNPSREKLLQLAFGLHLTVMETQQLMLVGEKNVLYPRIPRDAAILFCIHRKMDFIEVQCLLSENGFPLLGEQK